MDDATETERALAEAVRRGLAFVGPGEEPQAWQPVRGSLVRDLLLERLAAPIAGAAFAIARVRVTGGLDLSGLGRGEAPLPSLRLTECRVEGMLVLSDSATSRVEIRGCRIGGADFRNLLCSFDLNLTLSVIDSELLLMNARIGGNLVLNGTYLDARPGDPDTDDPTARAAQAPFRALSADGIDVRGDVFMRPIPGARSFIARGTVAFPGASIRGDVSLGGALIEGPCAAPDEAGRRTALGAALVLDRAEIGGDLNGMVQSGRRLDTIGRVSLAGARIRGDAIFSGADLGNDSGVALNADGVEIGQSLLLDSLPAEGDAGDPPGVLRCLVRGTIRLVDARIGSQVSMRGTKIEAIDEAVTAGGARIDGGLFLVPLFPSREGAEPLMTELRGTLGLPTATLGFCRLDGCRLEPGLARSEPFAPIASFEGATIRTALLVRLDPGSRGLLSLENAHVGNLPDLAVARWGEPPRIEAGGSWSGVRLELDELTYDRGDVSHEASAQARGRLDRSEDSRVVLEWLARRYVNGAPAPETFRPQPYEQAARLLRAKGDRYGAGRIGSAKRQLQRRCVDRGLAGVGNWLFQLFFDYGYSPARAVIWGLLFLALGLGGVELLKRSGGLVDAEPALSFAIRPEPAATAALVGETVRTDRPCTADTLGYTLDAFLPLVDLGFDRRCVVAPRESFPDARLADYGLLLYSLIGLVFVPIAALTFAGVLRSD